MHFIRRIDPTVQSLSAWATLITILLTGFYSAIGYISPAFRGLHWTVILLFGIVGALATLLGLAVIAAVAAWAFRQFTPSQQATSGKNAVSPPLDEVKIRDIVREEIISAPLITTGEKWPPDPPTPKPRLHLSRAEQERLTDRLIRLDDYLTGDLATIMQPVRELLNWQERLRFSNAGQLHAEVEAMRQPIAHQAREIGQALSGYERDTDVLGLNPMAIKTRFLPLNDALRDFTDISQALPGDSIHYAPLQMPGRQLSTVIGALSDEIERVRRDIADWRKMIAQGELG